MRVEDFVVASLKFFPPSFHRLPPLLPNPARRKEGSEKADGEGEEKEDPGREEEASEHRPSRRG